MAEAVFGSSNPPLGWVQLASCRVRSGPRPRRVSVWASSRRFEVTTPGLGVTSSEPDFVKTRLLLSEDLANVAPYLEHVANAEETWLWLPSPPDPRLVVGLKSLDRLFLGREDLRAPPLGDIEIRIRRRATFSLEARAVISDRSISLNTVQDLAGRLFMSPRAVQRRFARAGLSAREVLAKRHLLHTMRRHSDEGLGWSRAAHRSGRSLRAAQRSARRLFGRSLGNLRISTVAESLAADLTQLRNSSR